MTITYQTTKTKADLQGILDLQKANLPQAITTQELKQEGFVTIQHDLVLLEQMNHPHPHVIAKANEKVIGYTLVMLRQLSQVIPILVPMFEQINACTYKGQALAEAQYFIMGQVCIDKQYRGQGLFKGMYATLEKEMSPHFDYIITEIAQRNPRSLKAHYKIGFQDLTTYTADNGEVWVIVILEIGN